MYDINDKIFLCDWIQGTIESSDVNQVFDFLCTFADVERKYFNRFSSGLLNYSERWGYQDSGIFQICWNPDGYTKDMICNEGMPGYFTAALKGDVREAGRNAGIFLSISGDGLRKIGYENHNILFRWLHDIGFRCTRFDVAMDIFDPKNLLVPAVIEAWKGLHEPEYGKNKVATRMNKENFVIHSYRDSSRKCAVTNVEILQSKGHLGRFKMYDKWYEVHKLPRLKHQAEKLCKDIPCEYWYRFEYTVKTEYSVPLFNQFCENGYNLAALFRWMVGRMFTIKVAKSQGYQDNQLAEAQVWVDFIELLDQLADKLKYSFNLAKYK